MDKTRNRCRNSIGLNPFSIKSKSQSVACLPDPIAASSAAIQVGRLHVAAVQVWRLSARLMLVCSAPRTLLQDLPVPFFEKRKRKKQVSHGLASIASGTPKNLHCFGGNTLPGVRAIHPAVVCQGITEEPLIVGALGRKVHLECIVRYLFGQHRLGLSRVHGPLVNIPRCLVEAGREMGVAIILNKGRDSPPTSPPR